MPIATGVVTDFGASDITVAWLAPSRVPMSTALPAATSEPAASDTVTASADRRTRLNCRYNGTASATVAGPSMKCTNWAPSK
jgi:hypothetical protein